MGDVEVPNPSEEVVKDDDEGITTVPEKMGSEPRFTGGLS
jgi:hypothetical protein